MTEKKPSDVFLELWQWKALDLTPEQFAECARAWRQIMSLEEIYAAAERQKVLKDFWEIHPSWSPIVPAPTAPGPVTCAAADTSSGAAAPPSPPGEGVTYDCASAPMPDAAEEDEPEPEPESDPDASYTGYMSRIKNTTRERLLRMRKDKELTINDVLDASGGKLYWRDVMDMIEAKPVHFNKWELLAKVLDGMEEDEPSGG